MKRAGVIGWPVAHSLSPVLHGYWLKEYGIDGSYEKIPAAPEEFTSVIARLKAEGYAGVNVTVPHKEAAFALVPMPQHAARLTGAINLLRFLPNGIDGDNTDYKGLLHSIEESLGTDALKGKTVVLLGAGGAARGAVLALDELGAATVHILNRNRERASTLAYELSRGIYAKLVPGALADWEDTASGSSLLLNSTSAGMGDNPPLDLDLSLLPQNAAVCDIVYKPLETPLLKEAKVRGHRTIDGLGMLMHQAVPSFEAFFGVRPEVTPGLRAALVDALAHR